MANRNRDRNEFLGSLGLRVGLPFDSQFEINMPYSIVNASTVNKVGGSEREEDENTGSGMGDLAFGLAKTLVTERGWRPDVVRPGYLGYRYRRYHRQRGRSGRRFP